MKKLFAVVAVACCGLFAPSHAQSSEQPKMIPQIAFDTKTSSARYKWAEERWNKKTNEIIDEFLQKSPEYRELTYNVTAIFGEQCMALAMENMEVKLKFVEKDGGDIMSTASEHKNPHTVSININKLYNKNKLQGSEFFKKCVQDGLLNNKSLDDEIFKQIGATIVHEICGHVFLFDRIDFKGKGRNDPFVKLVHEAFANYVEYLYRRDVLKETWNGENTLMNYLRYAPLSEISPEYRMCILQFCTMDPQKNDYKFEMDWITIYQLLNLNIKNDEVSAAFIAAAKIKSYNALHRGMRVRPGVDIAAFYTLYEKKKRELSGTESDEFKKRYARSFCAAFKPGDVVDAIITSQALEWGVSSDTMKEKISEKIEEKTQINVNECE